MKKKGFTLVELLAVIVILSVIALITVPMILNVIENSRREATKITGNNYINYLEEHIAMEKLKNNTISDGEYEVIQDGKKLQKKEQTRSVITIEMNLKGKLPTSGSIIIKNGRVEEAELHMGKYTYTYKIDENGKALVSITKDGQIAPENVSLSLNSKASSITATITCPDTKGSKAKTYKYKLNDKSWIEKNTNIHEFNKLKEKTEYKVTAQCINDTGGMTEVSETTTTKELETPTFEIKPGSEEEWASERTVTITYPTGEGLKYSYSLDKGTTWIDTEDKETKVKFKENGNIIAKVLGEDEEGNEINVKITSACTVDGIDVTGPSDHKPSGVATTKSITVTSNQKDEESKIQKVEYAIYEDNKWSEWQSSDTFNGLKNGETYKIKTKATNKVGIFTESKEESVQTQDIPIPTYSESGNYKQKTVTITYSGNFTNSYSLDGGTTWKEVTGNSVNVNFNQNGSIIARSSDGKNYKTASAHTVKGIGNLTGIPSSNYNVGTKVSYLGYNWYIVKDNGDNSLLMMDGYLTASELKANLPSDVNSSNIDSKGNMKMCIFGTSSNYCSSFGSDVRDYSWKTSIIKPTIENWIKNKIESQNLSVDIELKLMAFSDGIENSVGYVRIPTYDEVYVESTTNYGPYYAGITGMYGSNYDYWTLTKDNRDSVVIYGHLDSNIKYALYSTWVCGNIAVRPMITVNEK